MSSIKKDPKQIPDPIVSNWMEKFLKNKAQALASANQSTAQPIEIVTFAILINDQKWF